MQDEAAQPAVEEAALDPHRGGLDADAPEAPAAIDLADDFADLTHGAVRRLDPSYITWMMENMDREVVDILRLYVHFDEPEVDVVPPVLERGSAGLAD